MDAEVEEVLPKEDLKAEASDLMVKFDPSGAKAETPFARNIYYISRLNLPIEVVLPFDVNVSRATLLFDALDC